MSAVEVYGKPVVGGVDAEMLRVLRNQCREWMTGNTDVIEYEDQQRWFAGIRPRDWRIFLYLDTPWPNVTDTFDAVAYGLLRLEGERWWLSFGVTEGRRGQGIGRQVAQHLLRCDVASEVWADVSYDNEASMRALMAAGFVREEDEPTAGIIRFKWTK